LTCRGARGVLSFQQGSKHNEEGRLIVNIDIGDHNGDIVITVQGSVNFSNSPELRKRILEPVAGATGKVIVDLEGVERIDSSGIATLVEAGAAAEHHGCRLWLCGVNGDARRMLDLVSLDFAFRICADVGEALNG
jgi:anti-sigma B factor antagonist